MPKFAFATALIVLSNVFVRLLSFVTMPVLTRLLTPEAYGTAAMATTLIGLVSVTALAGVDMSYLRASGAKEYSSADQIETFLWRFVIASAILAALVSFTIMNYASYGHDWPDYLAWLVAASTSASIMQAMVQVRARLQGRNAALAAATAGCGILATGVALVAACFVQDALPLILSGLVAYVSMVVLLRPPPVEALTRSMTLSVAQCRDILAIGLPGTVTALAYWVLSSADRWFLGYFADARAVGLYSVGYSIGVIGMVVNSAIFTVWTPEAIKLGGSNETRKFDRLALISEQLFVTMVFVGLCIAAFGGDIIALLASPGFHDARFVVPYIAGAVCSHGAIHLANVIFLMQKQLRLTIFWWCAGALLSALLNYILIFRLGIIGAACAFFLSASFVAAAMIIGARRLLPLPVNWLRLALIVIASASLATVLSPSWSRVPLQSLLFKMPAIALFAAMLALTYLAPLRSTLSNILRGTSYGE